MDHKKRIDQILPTLAYGDAIGNHVLALRSLLRQWGYASEIFAERWHPRLSGECRPYREYLHHSQPDNTLLLHYSIGGDVNRFVLDLSDQVILYYHNITPAHFFWDVNGELARQLDEARRGLETLAGRLPAIAASPYNHQELEQLGFQVLGVAPYLLSFDELDQGAQGKKARELQARYQNDETNDWLYVGRLAPNKCIHDLIKTFYYYQKWIQPASRLLLVGTGEGMEPYVQALHELVRGLDLEHSIVFAGHFGASEGLAAFYQMASLYVCMSEHEGFCIPLVESMHYDLPVLAHAAAGVPLTMGSSGVLVRAKDHAAIAELAHEVITNQDLRGRIIAGQRNRLQDHLAARARAELRSIVDRLETSACA